MIVLRSRECGVVVAEPMGITHLVQKTTTKVKKVFVGGVDMHNMGVSKPVYEPIDSQESIEPTYLVANWVIEEIQEHLPSLQKYLVPLDNKGESRE